jgi:hypothetical protein
MLLIGQADGSQGALSTPLIYASPDMRHTAEPVKLKMQESIVEIFTTGIQECASTVKITTVEMQWKLNEKVAKIKTTKAKAKQLERHLKEKGNVLLEKEEHIEEQAELIKALQAKRT